MEDPTAVVLRTLSRHPSNRPQYEALEDLKRATGALRSEGRYFAAGYGMAHGVYLAWGDRDAAEACIRQAYADYEQAVAASASNEPEAIAALINWVSLVGSNYVGDDPTEARQTDQAIDQVLAERLTRLAAAPDNAAPERSGFLIHGFHLTTDLRGDWRLRFPDFDVRRGMTTFESNAITFRIPSAFSVLVRGGDYQAAQEVAQACPDAFTTHESRGWRAATAGFTRPDEAVEHFTAAADHFSQDTIPDHPEPDSDGWSSINIELWARYFRGRAIVAEMVRSPERAAELTQQASMALAGTESGWVHPQVTCFRVVLQALSNLFANNGGDLSSEPKEELLLAARISGLDEMNSQALLFLDSIANAYEQLRDEPATALVSGELATALKILGRVPLFGQEVARAIAPAVGHRVHRALLGQEQTWIHRTLESIRDEAILRKILLRLFQASPPLYAQIRHGPIEYGKDIAVLAEADSDVTLAMYQVKAGDITKQNWPAARQELEEMFQVDLSDVQFPVEPTRREAVLVFNGHLNPYVEPVVQGWLEEQERDHGRSVHVQHQDYLVRWIIEARLINELRAAFIECGVLILEG